MELDSALKGMFDAQNNLRVAQAINDPARLSKHMYRLSQYTGAVETHLAELERDFDIEYAHKLNGFIMEEGIKPTPAEAKVKMVMGEQKGQITYLSRIVASSWKQVGVIQSRINHVLKESTTQI